MKKYLFFIVTIACCTVSASAQKIYVEDMLVVRNSLPQLPTSVDAIKKACKKEGKTTNCNDVKSILDITIRLRMDSMSMPVAMGMEEPGQNPGMLLMPEPAEQIKARTEALTKSIDSMEALLEKENILTIKNGKSDYHQTPKYGAALKDLAIRLRMPVFSNTYYHMNYKEREAFRDELYTTAGISRTTINHILAYEKLIFEKNKKNIFEMTGISSTQQLKFTEIQTMCSKSIKNLQDSIDKKFSDISNWKLKEQAKAKTPAEKTSINQLAATKNQKLLSSTHTLLIDRYNSLTWLYDQQLSILNEGLKNYEFGINATTNQEKQMQNMVAQSQLACYITMGTLADFCVFAHEIIVRYSGK